MASISCRLAHVGAVVGHRAAERLHLRHRAVDVAEAVEHDLGALARQRQRHAQADAAGGAGDEGGFSLQHGVLRAGCYDARIIEPGLRPDRTTMTEPRLHHVQCLDTRGLHRMAYWEWGDPANPRVLVCVHGLSRQGRDFDTLARDLCDRLPRGLPRRRRPRPQRPAGRPDGLRHPGLRGRHGDAAGAAGRRAGRLGRHLDGRADRPGPGQPAGHRRCAGWCSTTSARRSSRRRCSASAPTWASRRTGRRWTRRPTRCGPSRRASARTRASSGWR